ncbi:hypothetical protein [Ectothiorhodospira shaposhnikovii]|uniref:hypothetical protein n=1 Tax=Ectothiorhodospira shaposhnikovii TaxID=1054 RepID=UPI001EE97AA0|nr:hypothetical protein [Ectothiorhodospira shaposhnikovii]MCG5512869.1 hypothetical protein [Ectothiorhodospira shaposhnikovii]
MESQHNASISFGMAKEIAEAVALSAATKVAQELRHEMQMENKKLRDELLEGVRNEIKLYHGDMTPTEHAIQHARINRFLSWMDRTSQNVWAQVLKTIVSAMLFLFLLGYFLWNQGIGDKVLGG